MRQSQINVAFLSLALAVERFYLHFKAVDTRRGLGKNASRLVHHEARAVVIQNLELRRNGRHETLSLAAMLRIAGRTQSEPPLSLPARCLHGSDLALSPLQCDTR